MLSTRKFHVLIVDNFFPVQIVCRHIHTKHSIVTSGGLSKQPEIKSHHVVLQEKHCEPFKLLHPFTCMVVGMTGSEKTVWVQKFMEHAQQTIQPLPQRIVWCYSHWQRNRHTLVYCNRFRRLTLFVVFQQIWSRTGISIQTSTIYL